MSLVTKHCVVDSFFIWVQMRSLHRYERLLYSGPFSILSSLLIQLIHLPSVLHTIRNCLCNDCVILSQEIALPNAFTYFTFLVNLFVGLCFYPYGTNINYWENLYVIIWSIDNLKMTMVGVFISQHDLLWLLTWSCSVHILSPSLLTLFILLHLSIFLDWMSFLLCSMLHQTALCTVFMYCLHYLLGKSAYRK